MGLIAVQMSINPFELLMLVAICMVGALYLLGLPPPNSVRNMLGPTATYLWAGNLLVGGGAALCGGLWRHLERGLAFYQFGWGLSGIAILVYAVTLTITYPEQGLYSGITNILFAVACFTRVLQVQRFFKLSEQAPTSDLPGPLARRESR